MPQLVRKSQSSNDGQPKKASAKKSVPLPLLAVLVLCVAALGYMKLTAAGPPVPATSTPAATTPAPVNPASASTTTPTTPTPTTPAVPSGEDPALPADPTKPAPRSKPSAQPTGVKADLLIAPTKSYLQIVRTAKKKATSCADAACVATALTAVDGASEKAAHTTIGAVAAEQPKGGCRDAINRLTSSIDDEATLSKANLATGDAAVAALTTKRQTILGRLDVAVKTCA